MYHFARATHILQSSLCIFVAAPQAMRVIVPQ